MNSPMKICVSTLLVLFVGNAGAELKKLREWPSQVPVPSPELKRQYEFDPEAGAVSPRLVSTSTMVSSGSQIYQSSGVNFKNGVPVSGKTGWNWGVSAYHGFAMIMTKPTMSTSKLKFQSSSPWPPSELKLYSESTMSGQTFKSGIACIKNKTLAASTIFPTLPGSLVRYECNTSTGSTHENFTWAPGPQNYTTYYSDYLDSPIFTDTGAKQLGVVTVQEFNFLSPQGKEQKITIDYDKMRAALSQQ